MENEVFFRASTVSMLVCHLTLQSSSPGVFKDNIIIKTREQKVLPQSLSPQPLTSPDLNTASQPPLMGDKEHGRKSAGN